MFQLANSILPGHVWWENSTAYWLYASHPLVLQAVSMQHMGLPIFSVPSIPGGSSIQDLTSTLIRSADSNMRVWVWGDGRAGLILRSESGPFFRIVQSLEPGPDAWSVMQRFSAPIQVTTHDTDEDTAEACG